MPVAAEPMKTRQLLGRLAIAAELLRREPQILLRSHRFVRRMLQEGPLETLTRLRELTDPLELPQDYSAWLERHHDPTAEERDAMRAWAEGLEQAPRISVLMPVHNPNPAWLEEAIQSVRGQLYPHWELCIADDCSSDPKVRVVLEQAETLDKRVKVVFRSEHGHIARTSNNALELVTGEWVALLDHDDLLPADALIWVAKAILEQAEAQLIYSDEDKLDVEGHRFGAYFKPDWNPALIEGQNMFSHLGVYRASLMRQVGGFRVGMEGSQDYDLLLRCLDSIQGHGVVHIARVLYQWRVHRESTASGIEAKPYAKNAAVRALQNHFERCGEKVEVFSLPQGYRIRRALADRTPPVDLLVDARHTTRRQLRRSLNSLMRSSRATKAHFCGIYLAQTADHHDRLEPLLREFIASGGVVRHVELHRQLTQPAAFQHLIGVSEAPVLVFWDGRLEVRRGQEAWLDELLAQLQAPQVAGAGPKLLYPNGVISHAGLILLDHQLAAPAHRGIGADEPGYFGRANLTQDFSALPPLGLTMRRDAIDAVGGLLPDPALAPHWSLDLSLRLRSAGWRLVYTPFASLTWRVRCQSHPEALIGDQEDILASAALVRERWATWIRCDPAFSPNLSDHRLDFSLAWPPRWNRWMPDQD